MRTWNLFFELPGLDRSLFSPTLREPSLMACDDDVKGSGAASFEVFCVSLQSQHTYIARRGMGTYTLAFLAYHGRAVVDRDRAVPALEAPAL